eukprot:g32381.t1
MLIILSTRVKKRPSQFAAMSAFLHPLCHLMAKDGLGSVDDEMTQKCICTRWLIMWQRNLSGSYSAL